MMIKKMISGVVATLILVSCTGIPTYPTPISKATETLVAEIVQSPKVQGSNPTQSTDVVNQEALIRNLGFLSGEPCSAPCFLELTPGKTAFEDTKGILLKYLNHPSCRSPKENQIKCSRAKVGDIAVFSNPSTGLIDAISFIPDFQQPVYLKDVIENYGEPDYIDTYVVNNEVSIANAALYFDKLQTRVDLQMLYETSYDINEFSEIWVFYFLDVAEYQEFQTSTRQPWSGYGIYP